MQDRLQFDWDLIRRYDTRAPRYTSYPTAVQFNSNFSAADYEKQVLASDASPAPRPLSIYVHIPFCEHLCFYCACNKIATRNREKAAAYLDYLLREIDLKSSLFRKARRVDQLHFGGGTPTFFSPSRLAPIVERLRHWFSFSEDAAGDYSIEIDPRTVTPADLQALREIGFNRVSLGVQDFDPAVQKAVHRLQPRAQTLGIMEASRLAGMRSVNVDLIYGLPKQTLRSMRDTLGAVIEARPDRVSLFNYAHLPERFPAQRRIRSEDMPGADEKLEILKSSVEMVTAAGYVYVGMDHFALPDDELARAKSSGTLHRNFQGYTTHAGCELLGFGVSSIGHVGRCFSQNSYGVEDYQRCLEDGRLPIVKGTLMDSDDELRADIINRLMCFGRLDVQAVERQYGICFAEYFESELKELDVLLRDGLVNESEARIEVTDRGRMLVRNVCACFDRYLPTHQAERFSRAI